METNVSKRLRKCSAISLGILLATAFVLVLPAIQTTYAQEVTLEGVPPYHGCRLFNAPGDSDSDLIEMTTVRSGNIAKTVHSEKEIYECETVQGGIELVVEQTIFAEILENMNTREIIRTHAEVITCAIRESNAQFLGCVAEVPGTDAVPLTGCDQVNEMEFATSQNSVHKQKIVKTIHADKSVWGCNLDGNPNTGVDRSEINCDNSNAGCEKKVDIVIFADIWEDLELLPNDPVIKKEFLAFTCVVVLAEDGNGDGDIGNNQPNNQANEPEDYPARVESCRAHSS